MRKAREPVEHGRIALHRAAKCGLVQTTVLVRCRMRREHRIAHGKGGDASMMTRSWPTLQFHEDGRAGRIRNGETVHEIPPVVVDHGIGIDELIVARKFHYEPAHSLQLRHRGGDHAQIVTMRQLVELRVILYVLTPPRSPVSNRNIASGTNTDGRIFLMGRDLGYRHPCHAFSRSNDVHQARREKGTRRNENTITEIRVEPTNVCFVPRERHLELVESNFWNWMRTCVLTFRLHALHCQVDLLDQTFPGLDTDVRRLGQRTPHALVIDQTLTKVMELGE